MYVCFIKIISFHMDTSYCSFPYLYAIKLKINISGHMQNITILPSANNFAIKVTMQKL